MGGETGRSRGVADWRACLAAEASLHATPAAMHCSHPCGAIPVEPYLCSQHPSGHQYAAVVLIAPKVHSSVGHDAQHAAGGRQAGGQKEGDDCQHIRTSSGITGQRMHMLQPCRSSDRMSVQPAPGAIAAEEASPALCLIDAGQGGPQPCAAQLARLQHRQVAGGGVMSQVTRRRRRKWQRQAAALGGHSYLEQDFGALQGGNGGLGCGTRNSTSDQLLPGCSEGVL